MKFWCVLPLVLPLVWSDPVDGLHVERQPNCPERMETAMRDVDGLLFPSTNVLAVMKTHGQALREAAEEADRRDAALAQWEQVKHACWTH